MQNNPFLEWAQNFLENRGCYLKSPAVPVRLMPWSKVYQLETNVGHIYLKQMAPPFANEAQLLLGLGCRFPERVPEIVGHNDDLLCFLMFDAGSPLRLVLRGNYDRSLPIAVLSTYAAMQQTSVAEVSDFLSASVPDWRLDRLPFLYEELLAASQFLKKDGLTDTELQALVQTKERVFELCNQLSTYPISETIEHGDFHDNNVLINEAGAWVINDWGDAVISHPFFSMISFLRSAGIHHQIHSGSQRYLDLRDAYLKPWQSMVPKTILLEALELAEKLNPIKFSLSFYRISQCPGMESMGEYRGKIAQALREFLIR